MYQPRRRPARTQAVSPVDVSDPDLFGNDAGEDEDPAVLAAYFVESETFKRFYDHKNRLAVVRARKGMGKSALLAKFAYELKEVHKHPLVIHVTGADFVGFDGLDSQNFSSFVNKWRQVICSRVNLELAKTIGIAANDTEITLVETAEVEGYKGRNLLGCLLARMGGKLPGIEAGGVKMEGLTVTPVTAQNNFALLKRYSEENPEASVWLFVDDIDSTFVDNDASRARVSTFFSACRNLAREINGIKVRASVRTDVWTVISKNEDLDKFEQYIADIAWSGDEFRRILLKRILSYLHRKHPDQPQFKDLDIDRDEDRIYETVFVPRLRWGNKLVKPFNPIKILSAGRPRWMSQLCRLAGLEAKRHHRTHIGIQQFNSSMEKFGSYRLSDLYKEHAHQFSHLQKLVEVFSGGLSVYDTDSFIKKITESYVLKVGIASIPPIEGEKYHTPLQLAHFLFKIGFVVGRPMDNDYLVFEERPALLRHDLAVDRSMKWEIHPSYRQALAIHNKVVVSEAQRRSHWSRKRK